MVYTNVFTFLPVWLEWHGWWSAWRVNIREFMYVYSNMIFSQLLQSCSARTLKVTSSKSREMDRWVGPFLGSAVVHPITKIWNPGCPNHTWLFDRQGEVMYVLHTLIEWNRCQCNRWRTPGVKRFKDPPKNNKPLFEFNNYKQGLELKTCLVVGHEVNLTRISTSPPENAQIIPIYIFNLSCRVAENVWGEMRSSVGNDTARRPQHHINFNTRHYLPFLFQRASEIPHYILGGTARVPRVFVDAK